MQLMGGFIQEAVTSGSPAVLQSMCHAVLDIALLFTSPSPKLHEQLQQVTYENFPLPPWDHYFMVFSPSGVFDAADCPVATRPAANCPAADCPEFALLQLPCCRLPCCKLSCCKLPCCRPNPHQTALLGLNPVLHCIQVAQLSCLHYSNCHYLAHELVSLPFVVRPPMTTLLGPNWQFLDVAGDLKEAGQFQLDYQV